MEDKKNCGPFTIEVDNMVNNTLPPPYDMSGLSDNSGEGQGQYKPILESDLPSVQDSTLIALPEIIDCDDTSILIKNMDFTEKTIRQGFIKKVMCIVLRQYAITALVVYGLHQSRDYIVLATDYITAVLCTAIWVYLITFMAMICCVDARRRVPYNYIFLTMFTISMSVILSVVLLRYTLDKILFAAGTTLAIVLALTLFAVQTKVDFTLLSGSCLSLLLPLALLGIAVLSTSSDTMFLVYTTLGVMAASLYLVWDIQLIVGGGHRYAFSPEEYVFAALVLYTDIMYIFLKILRFSR